MSLPNGCSVSLHAKNELLSEMENEAAVCGSRNNPSPRNRFMEISWEYVEGSLHIWPEQCIFNRILAA